MPKVLYLLSHPIQYISPMLTMLSNKENIDLVVYYCSDHGIKNGIKKGTIDNQFGKEITWDTPLLAGYKYNFLKNYSPRPALAGKTTGLFNPGILKALRKEMPDYLIVHGWAYVTNIMAIIVAKAFGIKVLMRSETPWNQEIVKPRWLLFIKRLLLQHFLFKFIDSFLYMGQQNKRFYIEFGVKIDKLIFAPYAVNNEMFQDQFQLFNDKKNIIKKGLNIPEEKKVILTVGKYIPKKRHIDLLQAFFNMNNNDVLLLILGEGMLRQQMETMIQKSNNNNVVLTGFVNQTEISKYYAVADVFVLPSGIGETWGLVVNEAMNFGLPVLVSDTPGSGYDLVAQGENGYMYKTGDIDKLTNLVSNVLNDENFRETAGKVSISKIRQYSYDVMLNNLILYFESHR